MFSMPVYGYAGHQVYKLNLLRYHALAVLMDKAAKNIC